MSPFLLLFFAACAGPDTTIAKQEVDDDNDGYNEGVDCDDAHATVNPDAPEVCDGLDNDCDGTVDDDPTDATAWYADADGDRYGDPPTETWACDAPAGMVADGTDCDDAAAAAHPGGVEVCDELDNDCDGAVDDGVAELPTWYADDDGDTYGDAAAPVEACYAPAGHVADDSDCDDTRDDVHPDAPEPDCTDPVDHNCDGSTEYADADGDGWAACAECDDADPDRNPGAPELCAAGDEDCDGLDGDDDLDVSDPSTWYRDADTDGYAADTTGGVTQCTQPAGYVALGGDCDDADTAVNPGATEVCDAADTDEDCDGLTDDADPSTDSTSWTTWYRDADTDGWGDASRRLQQCESSAGYVTDGADCDDTDAAVHPGAAEVCDALDVDEDCDGLTDDDDGSATGLSTWFRDADADGHAGSTSTAACDQPAGFYATSTDCDDTSAAIHPGAAEVCDAADVDEDCDGLADDADASVSGRGTWFRDADADGYAGGTTTTACDQPAGASTTATDCNDTSAAIHPGAAEVCDAADVDEDCDGLADDADTSVSGRGTWYRDVDADGYAGGTTTTACDQPAGSSTTAADCDDAAADVHPDAPEVCGDGIDQDCASGDEVCPVPRYSGEYAVDVDYDTKIYGLSSADEYGYQVTGGDFDGDGNGDVFVTARFGTANGAYPSYGVVYGYYGPFAAGAQDADDHADVVYYNTTSTYAGPFGNQLQTVGDLDGDGSDDLWVGRSVGTYTGLVFLGGGGGVNPSSAADLVVTGYRAAGGALTGAAGADDLLAGDPGYSSSTGAAYVYAALSSTPAATLTGEATTDLAGMGVAVGDVDGDGLDDAWIGAGGNDAGGSAAGAVYLVYGPVGTSFGLSGADANVLGGAAGDYLGTYLYDAGDLDGDGHDDVVAGATRASHGAEVDAGALYALTGVVSGTYTVASAASATVLGNYAYDYISPAASVGDADGDGTPDLLVGTDVTSVHASDDGVTWLVYGPFAGTLVGGVDTDASWVGTSANDQLGQDVTFVPDLDGDGTDEIVMAATDGDHGGVSDRGAVWVFGGR